MGGLLKKLFGSSEPAAPARAAEPAPPNEDLGAALMRLTRTYWTRAPDELARLAPELDSLPWPKLLRLHHLISTELMHASGALSGGSSIDLPEGENTTLYIRTAARMVSADSPYLPKPASVIQRPRGTVQLPTRQGELRNASNTHHGALEVIRLKNNHPVALDFIGFGELARVSFGPQSLFPPANIQYRDGRNEVVCVPLLYGCSWFSTEPSDQNGSMTRFIGHHKQTQGGMGVGHSDFMCDGVMFGVGSVQQIDF